VALLAISGRPLTQIAAELGIAPSMLRNWRNRGGGRNAWPALRPNTPAPATHSVPDPAAEISRLRRENDRLRMERDILKKLWPSSRNPRNEVPPHPGSSRRLAGARHVRRAECVAVWIERRPIDLGSDAAEFINENRSDVVACHRVSGLCSRRSISARNRAAPWPSLARWSITGMPRERAPIWRWLGAAAAPLRRRADQRSQF
jgi:transposase